MPKTILITGSTDGIGLEAAKALYSQGQHVLLHGRSATKLKAAEKALSELSGDGRVESYLADLSSMADVETLGAVLADEFANASGKYFDNDKGRFALPHPDALDSRKFEKIVDTIEALLAEMGLPSQRHA
jgi:NAD(P)-dependent dehydrogenase (short-subunit alcohol dehydrogenase family)